MNIQSPRANAEYEAWLRTEAILDRYRELDLKEFGRSNIPPSESRQGYEGTRREHLLREENSSSNEHNHGGRPPPNPPSSDSDDDNSSKRGGGGPDRGPPERPGKGRSSSSSDSRDTANGGGYHPPPALRLPKPPKTILRSTNERNIAALRRSKDRSMSLGPLDVLGAEDEDELVYENAIVQKIRNTIHDRVGTEIPRDIAV
jgi:hypothetical protein